tara:strand:- start:1886 stop:2467 length:582 start_codon:yes stop_codon:yes gene_type:complete
MNRNLFFISSIILFAITLYAINNWIVIIDAPQAKSVYMSNKNAKIKKVKAYHKAAKDNYIFSKMMTNNRGSLIDAVITNHPKFWHSNTKEGIYEGFDSKFDKLIQNIIKNEDLDIDYKRSIKLGNSRYANNINKQLYQLEFICEYDNLVAFISTLEKNDRIYNIEELKIKNPIQKNTPGVYIHMKVNEINIGK